MAIFKCKMCGGSLDVQSGTTVATCEYCDTQQTIPQLDDERRVNLYDRANHFRRNNDFDKAMGIYEQIVTENGDDAEAYWSLVLCRYGIEYVEDPATHKRMPTINRVQYTSVFDDVNYKSALQYADSSQRDIYEAEAKAINEIQKGILAISQKEEPFDVFICYKETDNNGRRTPDSVLANDLYHQLIQEGYKVFFSRITLEDKLGTAYEPYIFAALNSAKVMVVLGTRPEYFNAVWVKNEWSRYLSLIKQGQKKILVPAYKDMDPYDLPEEFSHLQAQDMSKLGFMQDLIRGIKKIVQIEEAPVAVVKETVVSTGATNTAPLLKRAFMFLEDGDWTSADEYCEKVLDIDPECADAYLGKLMAELHVSKQDALKDCVDPFDHSNNYQKAVRFAESALKAELEAAVEHIYTRNEVNRLKGIYARAKATMDTAKSEIDYKRAADLFAGIRQYEDADALANDCYEKAEVCRKDGIYDKACAEWKAAVGTPQIMVQRLEKAIDQFKTLDGWKDSAEKIETYTQRIREIKEKEEADRVARRQRVEELRQAKIAQDKKKKKITAITVIATVLTIVLLVLLFKVIIPNSRYNTAMKLMDNGKYQEAITAFGKLDGYKNSQSQILECHYLHGLALMEDGKYKDAIAAFNASKKEVGEEKIAECEEELANIRLTNNKASLKNAKAGDIVIFGAYEQDNNVDKGKEEIEWMVLDVKDGKALLVSKYALDCYPYNITYEAVQWESCDLRNWLNENFFETAFSAGEQSIISPNNATQDNVLLLNADQANHYFATDAERGCYATAYAVGNGASVSSFSDHCWWWLRSSGTDQAVATVVRSDGSIGTYKNNVNDGANAVRPALWIDLTQL